MGIQNEITKIAQTYGIKLVGVNPYTVLSPQDIANKWEAVSTDAQSFTWLLDACRDADVSPPAGEAAGAPQRPDSAGGGRQATGQREAAALLRRSVQHHRTLDPD